MTSAGRVLVLNKGEWVAGNAYSPMDEVLYDGSSYVCKQAVLSNTAPKNDTAHWQLHARGFNDDQVAQFNQKADWILDHGVLIDEDSERVVGSTLQINADILGGEITKDDVKAKANKSDVLTLEEIKASSDVSGKIASASSVKDLNTKLVDKILIKDCGAQHVNMMSAGYSSVTITFNTDIPASDYSIISVMPTCGNGWCKPTLMGSQVDNGKYVYYLNIYNGAAGGREFDVSLTVVAVKNN